MKISHLLLGASTKISIIDSNYCIVQRSSQSIITLTDSTEKPTIDNLEEPKNDSSVDSVANLLSEYSFTTEQISLIQKYVQPELFSDDCDPIALTLSTLPPCYDPNFLSQLEDLSSGKMQALDIVSRSLNQELLAKYTEVLEALNLISDLNSKLNSSTKSIRQTREQLQMADNEICTNPQNFFRQIQKQRNLDSVLKLLNQVNSINQSSTQLNDALAHQKFKEAISICLRRSDLSTEIRQLTGVENTISSLQNMYSHVEAEMNIALDAMTHLFNRDVYDNLMEAYIQLNHLDKVPLNLLESFLKHYDTKYDQLVRFNKLDSISTKGFIDLYKKVLNIGHAVLSVHHQMVDCNRGNSRPEFQKVKRAIEDMAKNLWDHAESKSAAVLQNAPSSLKPEEFNTILRVTGDFETFGQTVVDYTANGKLQDALSTICSRYFNTHRKSSLEGTKEDLVNEIWEQCPWDETLTKAILTFTATDGSTSLSIRPPTDFQLSSTTNSCGNILKIIHKYLALIKASPSLSLEAFKGIRELTYYYAFSTLYIFLRPMSSPLSPFEFREGSVFLSQQTGVLLSVDQYNCLDRVLKTLDEVKQLFPQTSAGLPNDPQALLACAAHACDNMKGIAWYLGAINPTLAECIDNGSRDNSGHFKRFYDDIRMFLGNFSKYIFPYLVSTSLGQLSSFQEPIRNAKWNSSEVQTDPHDYTQGWARELQTFVDTVKQMSEDKVKSSYKNEMLNAAWEYSSYMFLAALASVQKCTDAGRTVMLADFRNIENCFNVATEKKVVIDTSWVIKWINAYFLENKEAFKQWAKDQCKRYTFMQMNSIVESSFSWKCSRQDRKELQAFIRELYPRNSP